MAPFTGVTQAKVDQLKAELAQGGMAVTQTGPGQYNINGHGVAATARFDVAATTLIVTIQHKPFIVSEGMIEDRIDAALRAVG